MRLAVWHMADDDGDLIGHRIAVHRDRAILASEQLGATDLIDESLTGIDAAIAVLRETASVATRLVAAANGGTPPAEPVALGDDQINLPAPAPDVTAPADPAARGPHR
jgi:hypothetical protein